MKLAISTPFTAIHTFFDQAFTIALNSVLGKIQSALNAPLVACVTLWIIVQGILVMRGEIDTRGGITKIITVSIVISLILGQANYHDFVVSFFEETIPSFVDHISGSKIPLVDIPHKLDVMFALSQVCFQKIASEIGPMNSQDTLAFEGAQWIFYGALWVTFEIYDACGILTKLLVAIGPLILVGYLFDHTRDMASKWVGQLLSYGLLLLLLNIVATLVIATEVAALAGVLFVINSAGTTAAKIIGLYELDMFFLAGDALIVALPMIASNIGGGTWAGTNKSLSLRRQLAQITRG
ncbi:MULTISPECIES: type IV secretion system protein [Rhizobium]|uniref:Type IV secretion system protein n=2 Tax=Rhizobium TaxID=379 RepID=A0A6N9ZNM4_9HYPH|nr:MULTISPECIES: type IV secretion system protein [Rhizobium]NEH94278.1 type IV secretion system protein [Rhizobium laguerreae]NEI67612.1 type IV secretion system protein [Rhizobium leguminosarum]NKL24467.1 type IV secretion system protein [Rhizobium leguminosarum bv. viciae]NKL39276.1 type IV secretion system protein [Rhizobium leguminosarum bv. viciae]NKL59764.1 type IV secretion system protein [Rhizobium leguminosarum bv. viciae]